MIPAEHGGQPDSHLRYETAALCSTSFRRAHGPSDSQGTLHGITL